MVSRRDLFSAIVILSLLPLPFSALAASVSSEVVVVSSLPSPPAAPTYLNVTPSSLSSVQLAWVDNAANESGFKVERKAGSGGVYAEMATVGADQITYDDTGLSSGVSYSYRVRAYNSDGNSAYTNEASSSVSAAVQVPQETAAVLGLPVQEESGVSSWPVGLDLNKDGNIGLADLSVMLYYYSGSASGQSVLSGDRSSDINKDGKVDLQDVSILLFYWSGR